jgi:hypothetical protein
MAAAGDVGVVVLGCSAGGALGGVLAAHYIGAKRSVSPRVMTAIVLATAAIAVAALVALAWPAPAHAKGILGTACSGASTIIGKFNGLLGNLGSGLCSLVGGSGGGGILSGLASALPKLIPAFLGGVIGWFLGSAALSHLLPGVFHLLIWTPVVTVTGSSPAGALEGKLAAVAAGGLASVVLMAAVWNWVAGMFDFEGGSQAISALSRGMGAALLLPIWVFVVPGFVTASDDLTSLLVSNSGGTANVLGGLLGVSGGAGAAGLFGEATKFKGFMLGVVLVLVAVVVLLLLLFALKVVVAAAATLLFVAFPLAIMVWPVRALGWLAEGVAEAFVVVLIIPVGWALILALMGTVASTFGITFHGGVPHFNGIPGLGSASLGLAGELLMPFIALVLLWMLVALPRQLIHLALLQTVSRRGFIGDTVHRTAVRSGSDWLRDQFSDRRGEPAAARPLQPAHETALASVAVGDGARTPAWEQATQALAVPAPPTARSGGGASGSSEAPATDRDGFAVLPMDQALVDQGIRQAEQTRQINPPGAGHLEAGLSVLPGEKRDAVTKAYERLDESGFTAQMVRQSLSEAHPRPHREVFQMFAASEPSDRAQAIDAALTRVGRSGSQA